MNKSSGYTNKMQKKTPSKPISVTGKEQKLGYKPEVTEEGGISPEGPGARSSRVRLEMWPRAQTTN